MPKTIKYTGSQVRWPELSTTGRQSVWTPGQQEERSDAEAALLLGTGQFSEVFAIDDLPLASLVAAVGNVPPGGYAPRILLNASPNLTLTDLSGGAGVTATPFGISCTVPGGVMGPSSVLRVYAMIDWVGGNSKNTFIKFGPVSGDWASATQVSGQSGLTNQLMTPVAAIIGNDGVMNRQRSTPANAVTWFGTSAASTATVTNVDTSLDSTIYVGVQFGTLNGTNTATLRRLIVELLP